MHDEREELQEEREYRLEKIGERTHYENNTIAREPGTLSVSADSSKEDGCCSMKFLELYEQITVVFDVVFVKMMCGCLNLLPQPAGDA